jgi:type IV pilus assembly protein PilW
MRRENGFTLIEVLIALSITAIVMASIYTTYLHYQQSYTVQREITFVQQNLRAAMHLMATELKMAGYDPSRDAGAGVVSVSTDPPTIRFTADLNSDGDTDDVDEDITYGLFTEDGVQKLGRRNPDVDQPVAEYIDALDFVFLDADNAQTVDPALVRSVQIAIVARSAKEDRFYTDNLFFTNLQGDVIYGPAGDSFRRILLKAQIKCRNLGL